MPASMNGDMFRAPGCGWAVVEVRQAVSESRRALGLFVLLRGDVIFFR